MNNGRVPSPARKPPAVIFDLDGTVADTLDDITGAVNYALEHTLREPLHRDAVRPMIGDGLPALMSRAAGTQEPPMVEFLVRRFQEHYDEHHLKTTRLYGDRAGMLMAILSNKPHTFTLLICDELLDPWPFAAIMGALEGLPGKPDPAGALSLAEAMKRDPADVFLVGDSAIDVNTAKAAGMRSVAVTWGFRDRDELVAADPDHVVDHPDELARVLAG
jgi:phosphoglycolate phosphatase